MNTGQLSTGWDVKLRREDFLPKSLVTQRGLWGGEGWEQIFVLEGCLWQWQGGAGLDAGRPVRRLRRSLREGEIRAKALARMEPRKMNKELESISLTAWMPGMCQVYMHDLIWFSL